MRWLRSAGQFVGCVLALSIALTRPAYAAKLPDGTDVPVYASDAFKSVAKKLLKQIVSASLVAVCSPEQPLCPRIMLELVEAADAAVNRDDSALKASLNRLFVDVTVSGMLQSGVEALFDQAPPLNRTREMKDLGPLRPVMTRLLRCVAAELTQASMARDSCTIGEAETQSFAEKPCSTLQLSTAECKAVETAFDDARRRKLKASTAARALAAIASAKQVQRPDIRILMLRLGSLLKEGIDDGLFAALLRFLQTNTGGEDDMLADFIGYAPGSDEYGIWSPAQDPSFRTALESCGQDAKAFNAYATARDQDQYIDTLRRSVLAGTPANTELLDKLADYECDPSKAGAETVYALKRAVRYQTTPLKIHGALRTFGAPALAAAALLDYVRTDDAAALDKNLRAAARFALQQGVILEYGQSLLKREEGGARATADAFKAQIGALCETRVLTAALEGVPLKAGGCYSYILDKQLALDPTDTSDEFKTFVERVKDQALAAAPGFDDPAMVAIVKTARRALTHWDSNDAVAARRAMGRLGVEFLLDEALDRLTRTIGSEARTCTQDAVNVSIIEADSGACAARLLIEAAYRPIADVLWESGITLANASDLSRRVHRQLKANPFLERSLLIANVGVGGNYIRGFPKHQAFWGENGYGALTLIDKFGVAIFKRRTDQYAFETGLFAGGFLDAIVRTVANTDQDKRFWLAGLTFGWPRAFGLDAGFEAHAAVVLPFEFNAESHYGWTVGGALVVPISVLFDEEE